MRPYVIRQGDYLTKLAHMRGFDGPTIWNHAKNNAIRERRTEPDMLLPGDILWIPAEPQPKELAIRATTSNRYIARIPKKPVSLKLQVGGEALANEPYVIMGLGDPIEGATDGEGFLKSEVHVHVREIEVLLTNKNVTLRLRIGDLDPPDTLSGLRKRLHHLGFYQPAKVGVENADAADGAAIVAALKSFQSNKKLAVTGRVDDDTKKALIDAHGS